MDLKERVFQLINDENYQKMTVDQIDEALSLPPTEFKNLLQIINSWEEDGTIYLTSKGYVHIASKLGIYYGKIISLKKYFGVCELSTGERINIDNQYLKNAYLNDTVRVHLLSQGSCEVMDIIKRNMWELPATYKNRQFICEEPYFPYDLKVKRDSHFSLVDGHVVLLSIDRYDGFTLLCHVEKILGHKNDPGMDILSEVINAGVPYEFSEKLLSFTDELLKEKEEKLSNDLAKRLDLSNELIVTIDGLDAKDLDDAISLKILKNGHFQLGIHIADVSHYVTHKNIIDKEAFKRGTSIYLADRVIPMLPHVLSNGICSLNQNVIRLTMSCIMEINFAGEVVDYDIQPSFIKSSGRLDYDDVNRLFENKETTFNYPPAMKKMLFEMQKLSSILSAKMMKRGYLELAIDEAKLIMDDKREKVLDIVKRTQGLSEKMIENFMILANETVASHIYYQQLPFIYRVHAAPSIEKIKGLAASLEELNIEFPIKKQKISPLILQSVLAKVKGTENEDVVSNLLLRSLSKACYSVNNIGHFGLGSDCYTHFTSPIRRYPDLIVHRLLKQYGVFNNFDQDINFLVMAAEQASLTERRATSLERDVEDIKKAEYMSSFIGCVYKGIITGNLDFGVFVSLDNTCEGLMRFDTINDFYSYNEAYFAKKFHIGQKIMVKVIACNVKKGEINFAYVNKKTYNKTGEKQNEKIGHK